MVGKHLDRVDICIGVHNPPRHSRPRIRGVLGCGTNPRQGPAHQKSIKNKPTQKRYQQPQIRQCEQDRRPDQIGQRIGNRVKDLKHHLARSGRRLHDPVGDPPGKVILEPADRLSQNLFVRSPADQSAEIRHNRIVQKQHIKPLKRRAEQQHKERNKNQLSAVGLPKQRRITAQQVHQTPHVVDQPDLNRRNDNRHESSQGKHLFKRLGVVPQKRPQLLRRFIVFGVGNVGVDEVFKETEHGKWPWNRNWQNDQDTQMRPDRNSRLGER